MTLPPVSPPPLASMIRTVKCFACDALIPARVVAQIEVSGVPLGVQIRHELHDCIEPENEDHSCLGYVIDTIGLNPSYPIAEELT